MYSNVTTTSDQWNCCRTAAPWSLVVKHRISQFGTWPVLHHALKPNSHQLPPPAMHWPSAPIRRCASRAAAMATSPSGICTIKHWCVNSKVIQTVPRALTSAQMAIACGPVAWTTQCARGIWGRDVNCNNMISLHKSSRLVSVLQVKCYCFWGLWSPSIITSRSLFY